MALLCGVTINLLALAVVHAQSSDGASGKEVAERLQRGVDNPEQEDNIYRGGEAVTSPEQVKENMKKLFKRLLVSEVGGEVDKAYNPHLRDSMFAQSNRGEQATARKKSGALLTIRIPLLNCWFCLNKFGTQTACKLCHDNPCPWVQRWFDRHVHYECCALPVPIDTSIYEKFTEDSNFKTCCVKKEMQRDSEELIACKSKHPVFNPQHWSKPNRGDGWSGLTEADFWTTALGLENDRTTSMIATRDEIKQCLEETDQLMENSDTESWVTGAIERNAKWADKAGGQGSGAGGNPGGSQVSQKVKEDIKDVRPSGDNKKLRFSDSLGSEGLTIRPNLAVMDRSEREKLAKRFCFRPEQFYKLMNPEYDSLQKEGGKDWQDLLPDTIPLWASYCPEGAKLMTNPDLSKIENLHKTSTDFKKGMEAWEEDPMYCQRIHAKENKNFENYKFDKVLEASGGGGQAKSEQEVGYTCLEGGKLNLGMVPVTFMRNRVVERRTAIADKLFGFFIAGTLATNPVMAEKNGGGAPKSYLKGFEPRTYSFKGPQTPDFNHRTFIGKAFKGSGTNELGDVCVSINGNDYHKKNKSDQLYISDYTHDSFTKDILVNVEGGGTNSNNAFNKYVQQWAKEDLDSQKAIAKREIDKSGSSSSDESPDRKVLNYASASRIVAVCPEGHLRWRPPQDEHNVVLNANLAFLCREENFGSPRAHMPP